MDLKPFTEIDPCGYVGLQVTQTNDLGITANTDTIGKSLLEILTAHLANGNTHD